jgi:7,8-dihydropterin-6-yl-methyl-4-(beta-D-ribofuranosyl)aminobenzene 5'-phosphate synthase
MRHILSAVLLLSTFSLHAQQAKNVKITILSTMLADEGIGEWGFSALVEVDGSRILFDAGARENTVIQNSAELNLDLSNITNLIFSHNHDDHTAAWLSVRKNLSAKNPAALSVTHVGDGFFLTRINRKSELNEKRRTDSARYVQTGGKVIVYDKFSNFMPGVYLTGPVPRKYPEKNFPAGLRIKTTDGSIEDNIPEDMSMAISTSKGIILLTGCGHAGIINTIDYVQQQLKQPVITVIGGLHLFKLGDKELQWTAEQLKKAGVQNLIGAHCTGIEAVYELRKSIGLDRKHCVVGAVGASYDLEKGIYPGAIAQ